MNQHRGGAWRHKQQVPSVLLLVRNPSGRRGVGSWFGQVQMSIFRVQNNSSTSACSGREHVGAAAAAGKQQHKLEKNMFTKQVLPRLSKQWEQVWRALNLSRCTFEYFRLSPPALM